MNQLLTFAAALPLALCAGMACAQAVSDPKALVRQIQSQGMDAQGAMSAMNAAAAKMGLKGGLADAGKYGDAFGGVTGQMFKGLVETVAPGSPAVENATKVLQLSGPPSLSAPPRWMGAGSLALTQPGAPGEDIRKRACTSLARSALGVNQPRSFTADRWPLMCAGLTGKG